MREFRKIEFLPDKNSEKIEPVETQDIDKILWTAWKSLVKINTKKTRDEREYFAEKSLEPLKEAMQYVEHYKGSFRSAIEEAYHIMTRVNKNMKTMTSRQIYEDSHEAFMCIVEARILRGCGFADLTRLPTEKEKQRAEKTLKRLKIY